MRLDDVYTVIKDQISRIEAEPNLPIMNVLQAENRLLTRLHRNLACDPLLAAKFKALTGTVDVQQPQHRL